MYGVFYVQRQSEVFRRKSSVPNITTSSIVLSPTVDEMRSGFRDTILQFEETVCKLLFHLFSVMCDCVFSVIVCSQ